MACNKDILRIIEQYDSIVIYRHVHSDYDAYGSQLGLKHLLIANYPTKDIYAVGDEDIVNPEFLEKMDTVNEDTIKNSLAILVDISNAARVENESYKLCKESIRIDHHPYTETLCDHEIIDTDASSASQLVVELAKDSNWLINEKAAEYLYAGISTDTLKMTIDKVDKRLFEDLAYLYGTKIDTNMVNRMIYDLTVDLFSTETKVRNKIIFDEDAAYVTFNTKELEEYGLDYRNAKDMVNIMGNIKGINKYAMFVQTDDGKYNVSLRSHSIPIVQIAEKYGGGGHPLASGISSINESDITDIVKMLKEAR